MNKEEQKKFIIEVMEADARDGLYHIGDTNKMVTAVEWLTKQFISFQTIESPIKYDMINEVVRQAKVIEKEQIMDAYIAGYKNAWADANSHVQEYVNTVIK
jgi:predicted transcriptional regulator